MLCKDCGHPTKSGECFNPECLNNKGDLILADMHRRGICPCGVPLRGNVCPACDPDLMGRREESLEVDMMLAERAELVQDREMRDKTRYETKHYRDMWDE